MSSVNENAHRTPWRLLWPGISILLSAVEKRKRRSRPVGLVYGKHASRFRIPRDKHEQRATANWNAWKHLRQPGKCAGNVELWRDQQRRARAKGAARGQVPVLILVCDSL